MPKNNSATFVANTTYGTIETTQLSSGKTVKIDAFILLELLEHNGRHPLSKYCHKCNMQITYDPTNFHLYSYPQVVNTYLTKGKDYRLKQYILNELKDVEKTSGISLKSKTIPNANNMINNHMPTIPPKSTLIDLSFERYLSSLASDDLLFLYNKKITMEAQTSREELLWEM